MKNEEIPKINIINPAPILKINTMNNTKKYILRLPVA